MEVTWAPGGLRGRRLALWFHQPCTVEDHAGEAGALQLLHGLRALVLVSGCQDDENAVARELPADLQPDSSVPSGDHCNPEVRSCIYARQREKRVSYY